MHIVVKTKICLHGDACAEFGNAISKFLMLQLAGTLGFLLHGIYLAKPHYCIGKSMVAGRRFCRMWSCNCKLLKYAISQNAWHSFVYSLKMRISAKTKQCFYADFFAEIGAVTARFLGKYLSGLFGSLMHNIYLEKAHYCKGKSMFASRRFLLN